MIPGGNQRRQDAETWVREAVEESFIDDPGLQPTSRLHKSSSGCRTPPYMVFLLHTTDSVDYNSFFCTIFIALLPYKQAVTPRLPGSTSLARKLPIVCSAEHYNC